MSLAGAVAALLLAHLVASAEFDESRLRTVYSSENRTLSVYLSDVSVWTNRSTDTIAVALLRVFPESLVLPIRSPQLLNIDRQQNEVAPAHFRHIYRGRYCVWIGEYGRPQGGNSTLLNEPMLPCSRRTHLVHQVQDEPDVFAWNLVLDVLPSHGRNTSGLRVDLALTQQDIYEFDGFHVHLYASQRSLDACRSTDDALNSYIHLNGTTRRQSFTFSNLRHGIYCIVIDPDDDRCRYIELDQSCARHRLISLPKITISGNQVLDLGVKYHVAPFVALAVLLLIVFSFTLFYLWQFGSIHRRYPDFLVDLKKTPLQVSVTRILLLHSAKQDTTLRHVQYLKKILDPHRIWDNTDGTEDIEGIQWFANRLLDPSTKVLVVLCRQMRRAGRLIQRADEVVDGADGVELLLLHRLHLILHLPAASHYQRIFVVRFDDDDDDIDEEDAPFLATPRRCYHLPGDWLQLRRDLSASQSQSSASQPSA